MCVYWSETTELAFVSFGCRQLCLGVWQHVAFSASIQSTLEDSSVLFPPAPLLYTALVFEATLKHDGLGRNGSKYSTK